MKKKLTEKQALKKLDISDFKSLPSSKLDDFAKILPEMDPKVAEKALEQIPEFTKSAVQIANYNKEIFTNGINSKDVSTRTAYNICDSIIHVYEERLNDSLSEEERSECIKNLLEIAKITKDINKSHQSSTVKILLICAGAFLALLLMPVIVIVAIVALFFLPVTLILLVFILKNKLSKK